jgi:hypothetical protein
MPLMPAVAAAQTRGELHDGMRKLWIDHVTWTRLFIISAAANLPDKDATTQRLLQNQTDIGSAIVPYYGKDAGDKLTSLLKEHILIAADRVGAAKAGDKVKSDRSTRNGGSTPRTSPTFCTAPTRSIGRSRRYARRCSRIWIRR